MPAEPTISPYEPEDREAVLELSVRAWRPVLETFRSAAPSFIFRRFYPQGWETQQRTDIAAVLADDRTTVWLAKLAGDLAGFIGTREHPGNDMGEVYVIAVDPEHQRGGVGTALLSHAEAKLKESGFPFVMIETGGDPGHAPARRHYEHAGYTLLPVARYFKEVD